VWSSRFAIDQYAKIESGRLMFLCTNQDQLRADIYNHFKDRMLNGGLQPTVPGHTHQYFEDAMSHVRKFGCADRSITFTCDPKWHEIASKLFPNQTSRDRYDLVCPMNRSNSPG